MNKDLKNELLMARQYKHTGVFMNRRDVETLRKAELTLNRWSTETANGTIQRSMGCIVRVNPNVSKLYGENVQTVPDRETGALRRIAEVCKRNGLEYFHQQDPRGCSLYISKIGECINDSNYPSFIACSVR